MNYFFGNLRFLFTCDRGMAPNTAAILDVSLLGRFDPYSYLLGPFNQNKKKSSVNKV